MKLFKNHIDIENGLVYSTRNDGEILGTNKINGYSELEIYDIYGNKYKRAHEVIVAEALQLPKHLWPLDENGRRFEIDHIIPVKDGGTDAISNLRLVSRKDNANNPRTLARQSELHKNQDLSYLYTEEVRKKISDANKGRTPWIKGKHMLDETKKKLSDANRNNKFSKPIIEIKDNGDKIEYPSIRECGRLGFTRHMIRECIDGKREKYKGSRWIEK